MLRRGVAACLLGAVFLSQSVLAHSDAADFDTIEFRCYDIPKLLRKQATHQQVFLLSNLYEVDVFWTIWAANWAGDLAINLARREGSGWGTLEAYSTTSFTNTDLQLRNTSPGREEPASLCLRNNKDRGKYRGVVSIREMVRIGNQWTAYDLTLTEWYSYWAVTPAAQGNLASSSPPVPQVQRSPSP